MAQNVFSSINPSTTSGTQLATILNDFKNALMSGLSGTSRPTELTAGGAWIDTSQEGSPNFLWSYKVWTGSVDITIFQVNLATSSIIFSGSESLFQILKVSADAVAPTLKMVKRRIATSGQVLSGDAIGQLEAWARASDGTDYLTTVIKAVAGQNQTASAQGSYLVWEQTLNGSASRAETMRLIEGKLGVGITAPEASVHTRGTTGIKSERLADDALGAQFTMRKKRVTGNGSTQSGDVIGSIVANTTDDNTAEQTSAQVDIVATEAHTASARGTKWLWKVVKAGATALTSVMEIGEEIKSLVLHSFEMMKLNAQDVATTASINQLSADKTLVRMTGSTATDIRGINSAAGKTKVITIHNDSSAVVTCKHANGTATAADRFDLPSGRDVQIKAGSSAEFFYDETDSRWKVKSGAGSGGGEVIVSGTRASPTAITAVGGITASTTDADTLQFVEANSGHISISANPQISAGFQVGQRLTLIGRNNDKTITISNGNGVSSNGDIVLAEDSIVMGYWDGTNWNLAQLK